MVRSWPCWVEGWGRSPLGLDNSERIRGRSKSVPEARFGQGSRLVISLEKKDPRRRVVRARVGLWQSAVTDQIRERGGVDPDRVVDAVP